MLAKAATLAQMAKFDTDQHADAVAGAGALQVTRWQQSAG